MQDEHEKQQQQQQHPMSPTDNRLPEWKSSDPYLASILRHLRATDHHLDGIDYRYRMMYMYCLDTASLS